MELRLTLLYGTITNKTAMVAVLQMMINFMRLMEAPFYSVVK